MTFLRKGKKTKAYYDLNDLGDNDEEFHEFLQYTESNQFPGEFYSSFFLMPGVLLNHNIMLIRCCLPGS